MSFSFSVLATQIESSRVILWNVVTSWTLRPDPNSLMQTTDGLTALNWRSISPYQDAKSLWLIKVQLQPDPNRTEITQLPVFRWKNGDFYVARQHHIHMAASGGNLQR